MLRGADCRRRAKPLSASTPRAGERVALQECPSLELRVPIPTTRAVKLAPGNTAILDTYAAALFQFGRYEQTLGKYEQSCRSEATKQS